MFLVPLIDGIYNNAPNDLKIRCSIDGELCEDEKLIRLKFEKTFE